MVHKDFACHYSPVFKAAFNSDFVEGQTQEYRLQEVKGTIIRVLINWFYTQKLDTEAFALKETTDQGCPMTDFIMLTQLWILAGKLLIPTLQNTTIRQFLRLRNEEGTVPVSCFHAVYEGTSPGSALRRLCVDMCIKRLHRSTYIDKPESFPKDMLIDLVTVLAKSIPVSKMNDADAYLVSES